MRVSGMPAKSQCGAERVASIGSEAAPLKRDAKVCVVAVDDGAGVRGFERPVGRLLGAAAANESTDRKSVV